MNEIKLSYQFNDQNYHGAYKAHMQHRYKRWIYLRSFICICMILLGGYLMTFTKERAFAYMFVTAGSLAFLRPIIWQMWHERIARKNPAWGSKLHFTFNDEGVSLSGNQGSFTFPWADLFEVYLAKKGILIYLNRKKYLWIPYSAAEGKLEQLSVMIEKNKVC
ncbi:YcxB family protein [Akkermansiaceae bacterium]|nr:YcxB family protein [Akkermansiaceae bacterium]